MNLFFLRWLCASSKVVTLMMVVWTMNDCCVSVMLGLWGFFLFVFLGGGGGVYLGHLVIRVKSIQRLTSTHPPPVCTTVVPTPPQRNLTNVHVSAHQVPC